MRQSQAVYFSGFDGVRKSRRKAVYVRLVLFSVIWEEDYIRSFFSGRLREGYVAWITNDAMKAGNGK